MYVWIPACVRFMFYEKSYHLFDSRLQLTRIHKDRLKYVKLKFLVCILYCFLRFISTVYVILIFNFALYNNIDVTTKVHVTTPSVRLTTCIFRNVYFWIEFSYYVILKTKKEKQIHLLLQIIKLGSHYYMAKSFQNFPRNIVQN